MMIVAMYVIVIVHDHLIVEAVHLVVVIIMSVVMFVIARIETPLQARPNLPKQSSEMF